jgi:glycosyltransferase involved in cell wall biosynthesis
MGAPKALNIEYPMVSVIIPARNEEQYLGLCLKSVLQIDYPEDLIEVIVVDNNSTDRTADVAAEYGAKVIYSKALTIAAVRNEGARHARGEILAFIDADIVVDRDWLKKAVVHFERDGIGAVGSRPVMGEPSTLTLVEKLWDRMVHPPVSPLRMVRYLPTSNLVVKAKYFHSVGGFDEEMETCEDPEFGFRLSRVAGIIDDRSIRVTHLRNPKNFMEFFWKMYWHGKGLLKGLFRYSGNPAALPSVLLPIGYLAILFSLLVSAFVSFSAFLAHIIIFLLLPLLYCIRSCHRSREYGHFASFYYLHFLYMIARSLSFAVSVVGRIIARSNTSR